MVHIRIKTWTNYSTAPASTHTQRDRTITQYSVQHTMTTRRLDRDHKRNSGRACPAATTVQDSTVGHSECSCGTASPQPEGSFRCPSAKGGHLQLPLCQCMVRLKADWSKSLNRAPTTARHLSEPVSYTPILSPAVHTSRTETSVHVMHEPVLSAVQCR